LSADRDEGPICRHAYLERARGNLPRDDEPAVDIDPVVNPRVDPRLSGLAPHREVAPALIRELRIEHEANGAGDAHVVARIRGMVRHTHDTQALSGLTG